MNKRILSIISVLAMLMSFVPVRAKAEMSINIGEYLQMGTYYGQPILWRCVDIDENGPLMLSDKILCLKAFDAVGNNNTGSHSEGKCSYESNYWADSNMRSWLNSNASAGNVNWLCGNPPVASEVDCNSYDDEAGFLTNFTASEQNVMKSVTQKSLLAYFEAHNGIYTTGTEMHTYIDNISNVVQNYDSAYAEYVTDKMFLLDVKQVNEVYNNGSILGSNYYIGEPTAECVENSEYKSFHLATGKEWFYWLRSPFPRSINCVRSVGLRDGMGYCSACVGYSGVRPAFYLNQSSSICWGNGTSENPHTIVGGDDSPGDDSPRDAGKNRVTINGHGTAYGRFPVTNTDGNVAKSRTVYYTINGSNTYRGVTDEDGYLTVGISNISSSSDYDIAISGSGIEDATGVLEVTVEPLHFKSTYEASLTTGANVGVGIGVGGSIGKLEAEAKAAEVGAGGANRKSFSVSQDYSDNKNKLEISTKQSLDAAIEAKVGLFAGANVGSAAGVKISAGDVHGSASYGNTFGMSFEDEDFNASDKSDVINLAKFMFAASIESVDLNVVTRYIIDKINAPANAYEKGSAASLEPGASLGVISANIGDNIEGSVTLAGLDCKSVWSNSTKTMADNSKEYESSVSAESNISLLKLGLKRKDGDTEVGSSASVWSGTDASDISLSAKESSGGVIEEIAVSATKTDDNSIFWGKNVKDRKETFSHTGDNAQSIAASCTPLYNFAKGNKAYFTLGQMGESVDSIVNSESTGEYSYSIEQKKGVDIDLSASVQLLLEVGGKIGVSGIESYEYEEKNGIFEDGTVYIQAKNDIADDVENKFIGVGDLVIMAKDEITQMLTGWLDKIEGWLDSAGEAMVEAGNAVVEGVTDAGKWLVSIVTPSDTIGTMSILAVDDEVSLFSTSSLATTIGEPYVISITDEDGNAVTDFSDNPLKLTLKYTEEQLIASGVSDISNISIMRWDDEKSVYIRMGGTLDEMNSCVSIDITKPGQYILAVDNCPPAITEFLASAGTSPEISAVVSDMSGIADFEFSIDDTKLLDLSNFEDYYDFTTGEFKYPTSGLLEGSHEASIYAVDTFGNEISQDITFTVNLSTPQITDVTQLGSVITQGTTVIAKVSGENITGVFLNTEVTDIFGNITKSSDEMMGTDGIYSAVIPEIPNGYTVSVSVRAYNTFGNRAESDTQKATIMASDSSPAVAVTEVRDNAVTVKCTGFNSAGASNVYLAVYNEYGVLSQIKSAVLSNDIKFSDINTNGTIKAFVWSDTTPLCENSVVYQR